MRLRSHKTLHLSPRKNIANRPSQPHSHRKLASNRSHDDKALQRTRILERQIVGIAHPVQARLLKLLARGLSQHAGPPRDPPQDGRGRWLLGSLCMRSQRRQPAGMHGLWRGLLARRKCSLSAHDQDSGWTLCHPGAHHRPCIRPTAQPPLLTSHTPSTEGHTSSPNHVTLLRLIDPLPLITPLPPLLPCLHSGDQGLLAALRRPPRRWRHRPHRRPPCP